METADFYWSYNRSIIIVSLSEGLQLAANAESSVEADVLVVVQPTCKKILLVVLLQATVLLFAYKRHHTAYHMFKGRDVTVYYATFP